jgi:hypothetical protein
MRSALLVTAIALAGCATAPPPEPTRWLRSDMSGPQLERQSQIDRAECGAISYQNVAVPATPTYNPYLRDGPKEYEITGRTNGYDQTLGAYSGTYTATVREPIDYDTMGAFRQAREAAQRSREFENAVSMRANLYEACLLRRGWYKDSGEATYTAAQVQAAVVQSAPEYQPPTITRRPTRQGE